MGNDMNAEEVKKVEARNTVLNDGLKEYTSKASSLETELRMTREFLTKCEDELSKVSSELVSSKVAIASDLKSTQDLLARSNEELTTAREQLKELDHLRHQLELQKRRLAHGDGAIKQLENLKSLLDETQRQLASRDSSLSESQRIIEKLLKIKRRYSL